VKATAIGRCPVAPALGPPCNKGKFPATKARRVLAALLRIGWAIKRQGGTSHRVLERAGWPDYTWAWHDDVEIGPVALAKIAKNTGLRPEDL